MMDSHTGKSTLSRWPKTLARQAVPALLLHLSLYRPGCLDRVKHEKSSSKLRGCRQATGIALDD